MQSADDDWQSLLDARTAESTGVAVNSGPLWHCYAPILNGRSAPDRPFVVAHVAQSLDGYLATCDGESRCISGDGDFDHLHRLRALCDAVLVGGETARLDDPRLTTRRVTGPNPLRVIACGNAGLPTTLRVLNDGEAPTLIAHGGGVTAPGTNPSAHVAWVNTAMPGNTRVDLGALLAHLAARGVRRLLVEGGGQLIRALLSLRLVDRLQIATAPLVLGAGRPGLGALSDLPRTAPMRHLRAGDDLIWDLPLSTQPV